MIEDYTTQWQGIPVENYTPEQALECPNRIYRLAFSWDSQIPQKDLFASYLKDPAATASVGLSLGLPDESASDFYEHAVTPLLAKAATFPKLRWLFLGEMTQEDSELTWIGQGDVGAPVLTAFPLLEELHVRGGEGDGDLAFTRTAHPKLKKLVVQTAGMTKEMFMGIVTSDFPELDTLELWLGSEERGSDCTSDHVRDLLMGNPFPKLKSLTLGNSEIATDIALELGSAPILQQLEHLSLEGGTLQDYGAKALLSSDLLPQIKSISFRHHYLSDAIIEALKKRLPQADLTEQEEADSTPDTSYYYIAVSE